MLLGPIGPKIQVLLSPPIQGGPWSIFRGPPPLQGALAKFWPVTIVYIGATIAEFLVAISPPIRGSIHEKCFENFESDISGSFVPGAISTPDFA